jgi:DNA-binding response OmpR family regulator
LTLSSSSNVDSEPLKGIHVLVVEDNRSVAQALASTLSDIGLTVAGPVATQRDARRLVLEQRPQLVLLDLSLDGELATELVHWLCRRGVPVIVMSGMAVPPKSISEDAVFLQKPFGASELLAAMHDVMLAA